MVHAPPAKSLLLLFTLLAPAAAVILRQLDVPYGSNPRQALDVYWESTLQDAAIFVNIHGGGWSRGDKASFADVPKAEYFAQVSCILVASNYRLRDSIDNATGFEMISDVWSAVAYVRRHAAEYSADPNKVFVGGGSAGGHLSACIAYCQSQTGLRERRTTGTWPG